MYSNVHMTPQFNPLCIACFLDPLQETHCLFLGSVTGDYCLFLGSFYPDNLSLIRYFKAEGGLQRNFHLVYSVYKGDIFEIWKNLFRWQGPFNKPQFAQSKLRTTICTVQFVKIKWHIGNCTKQILKSSLRKVIYIEQLICMTQITQSNIPTACITKQF